jgi:hypothetical protein
MDNAAQLAVHVKWLQENPDAVWIGLNQGIINTAKGSNPSELAPSETLRLSPGPSIFIRGPTGARS